MMHPSAGQTAVIILSAIYGLYFAGFLVEYIYIIRPRNHAIDFCKNYIRRLQKHDNGYEHACWEFGLVSECIDAQCLTRAEIGMSKGQIARLALRSFHRYMAWFRCQHRMTLKDGLYTWQQISDAAQRLRDMRKIHKTFKTTVRRLIAGRFFIGF